MNMCTESFYLHENQCMQILKLLSPDCNLGQLQKYMGKPEKVATVNSFIYANFTYCLLVLHFSSCELIRKIEKIRKCCLRIVPDDYESNYDILLRKSEEVTMEIKQLRVLVIGNFLIFKQSIIFIQTI